MCYNSGTQLNGEKTQMKVKKFLVGAILASLLTLSGCNGAGGNGGNNYFKEYSFEKTATEKQVKEIKEGLKKSLADLSSLTQKVEERENNNLEKSEQTMETSVKVYQDSSKDYQDNLILESTGKQKTNVTANGITLKETTEQSATMWDAGNEYYYTLSSIQKNGDKTPEESHERNAIPATSSKAFKEQMLGMFVPTAFTGDCYINSDGSYTVVEDSDIVRNVTAVEWGKETKVRVNQTKHQRVFTISKDYRLTGGYEYNETKTNRDPATGEYYSSEKVVEYRYVSYKFEYGKKESKTVASLNQSIATKEFIDNMYVDFYQVSAEQGTNKQYTVTDNATNPSGNRIAYKSGESYRFSTSSISGSYVENNYYGQRFELNLSVFVGTSTEAVEKKVPLDLTQVQIDEDADYTVVYANNKSYLLNLSSYSSSFEIYVNYNGTTAVAESISASY